ncbi:hypothetical protein C8J56DRAFT_67317 [Mycena floridula]|nr:hypothetical protein C8J56DRAFT_67317 [Mycena floridula]
MSFAFDDTLGAAFIGYSISCIAFGILLSQLAKYFSRYPADKVAYKVIVLSIGVIEATDQAFITHAMYHYNISDYGNPLFLLGTATWSLIVQISLGALVGLIVKICYALRVWRFSGHNYFITGIIIVLCLGQFALELLFTIDSFKLRYFVHLPELKTLGTITLGLGVLTDVVIAAALCFYLKRLRNNYKRADMVTNLMVYAVNTGILTSAISASTLLCYNLMPTNFIFIGFYFVLSKLYAISFLATLNTRRSVNNRGTDRNDSGRDIELAIGGSPAWKSRSRLSSTTPGSTTRFSSTTKLSETVTPGSSTTKFFESLQSPGSTTRFSSTTKLVETSRFSESLQSPKSAPAMIAIPDQPFRSLEPRSFGSTQSPSFSVVSPTLRNFSMPSPTLNFLGTQTPTSVLSPGSKNFSLAQSPGSELSVLLPVATPRSGHF